MAWKLHKDYLTNKQNMFIALQWDKLVKDKAIQTLIAV